MTSKKTIFSIIVAVLAVVAIIFYHDTMSLTELISSFVAASTTIVGVWNWFSKKEIAAAFKEQTGASYKMYKKTR